MKATEKSSEKSTKKATREIFLLTCRTYRECRDLASDGIFLEDDNTGTYTSFNVLSKEYDFDNEVFTDEAGNEGVKWCFGEVMVPARYDKVKYDTLYGVPTTRNFTIASRGGRDYLINFRGKEIFSADEICPNGGAITPAAFRLGDKWGIVGSTGKVRSEMYDKIRFDSNGFTFLERDGKHGFIFNGVTVEPKFDSIEFDEDDVMTVTLDGREGYVDADGEFTEDPDEAFFRFDMIL